MPTNRVTLAVTLIALYAVALSYACAKDEPSSAGEDTSNGYVGPGPGAANPASAKTYRATATIRPTTDASRVEGVVDFVEDGGETVMTIDVVRGGFPSGHGLHIFENGSCAPLDGGAALAAGGHWNPTDAGHGLPNYPRHHVGDLGNVDIDPTGRGSKTLSSKEFTVRDGGLSVVGRAIIFHDWPDDGVSPIDGNSGNRVGCGIIEPKGDERRKK